MSSEEAFLKKLRAAFCLEAHEQIERISSALTKLAGDADHATRGGLVESTFRELHNLKGSARAVNLPQFEDLCQVMEDIFTQLKRQERAVTPSLMDSLHTVVDTISDELHQLESNSEFALESVRMAQCLENLQKLLAPNRSDSTDKSSDSNDESVESILNSFVFSNTHVDLSPQQRLPHGAPNVVPARESPATEAPLPGESAGPATAVETSRDAVRISAARLDEFLIRAEDMLSLKIVSRQHNHDLNNVGFKFDTFAREVAKVYADVRAARQMIDRDAATPEQLYIDSVLVKVLEFFDQQQQHMSALGSQLTSLKSSSLSDFRLTSTTVDTFLESTKKLLMMPASSILDMMPKMVRELARELGKELDFTITGGNILLDKRVLAQVKDPILHILRNSIDHGMESPQARSLAGKSARGSLSLGIQQSGGNTVEIVIADDGSGIKIDRVKEIGVERGLITREKALAMTDKDAIDLIFQSSFSTSKTISEISGRGLGLAIARENIENMGGTLQVMSKSGWGTTFSINLPVTLATFRGVLILCANETVIVPTSDMDRLLKLRSDQVEQSDSGESFNFDGKQIKLVRLSDVLGFSTSSAKADYRLVMVLRHGGSTHGFEIDEVLEEQEVLVKPLPKPLIKVRNVSAVTVLGNGKPAAILNVSDLFNCAVQAQRGSQLSEVQAQSGRKRQILVVDDTITARILMKNILESAGYQVKTANDGAEGLKLIEKDEFDMLVTDIEMPNMNGIELTSAVRKSGRTLPVILVTSMTDQHYRDLGTEAGADAFFVKKSFDQQNLLDIIKRLM